MSTSKHLSLDALVARIRTWRDDGNTVVFTNGCFDLLHDGHRHLLHEARRLGDRLVVGLNSDGSVRRLKGEGRPVNALERRIADLCNESGVDAVVVFEEDTPEALLEALRPDVLVKGGDYTLDEVVGRDIVESYGGRVATVSFLPGHSTTGRVAGGTSSNA